jgi:hypothetical protein
MKLPLKKCSPFAFVGSFVLFLERNRFSNRREIVKIDTHNQNKNWDEFHTACGVNVHRVSISMFSAC